MLVDVSDEDAMAKAKAGGGGPLEEQVTIQTLCMIRRNEEAKEQDRRYVLILGISIAFEDRPEGAW